MILTKFIKGLKKEFGHLRLDSSVTMSTLSNARRGPINECLSEIEYAHTFTFTVLLVLIILFIIQACIVIYRSYVNVNEANDRWLSSLIYTACAGSALVTLLSFFSNRYTAKAKECITIHQ